ncbi:hypothetical protein BDV96DRAFT_207508 [Lophiotrema nucula]|uniref:Uncharacterized protein n=1 Tax=Lophiotrema nucula TaxID=690887 RepID=A0A6A5ZQK7_9PLEO|nr:hypothetical protein BDV96DRAFT_207508 [Lophiotrema nucula]
MMAPIRESIDLTIDSDDEGPPPPLLPPPRPKKTPVPFPTIGQTTKGTLSSRLKQTPVPLPVRASQSASPAPILAKTAVKKHSNSPVPLPSNVRHLERPSSSFPSPTSSTNAPSPHNAPQVAKSGATTQWLSNGHDSAGSSNEIRNGASSTYASVYNGGGKADAIGAGIHQQPVKRRKLSWMENPHGSVARSPAQESTPVGGKQNGSNYKYEATGFGTLRAIPISSGHHGGSLLQSTDRGPSIQALNSMMKTKEQKHTIPEELLTTKPRLLNIGKTTIPSKNYLSSMPSGRITTITAPTPSSHLPPSPAIRNGPGLLGSKDIKLSEDATTVMDIFRPRSAPIQIPTTTIVPPIRDMDQNLSPLPNSVSHATHKAATATAEYTRPGIRDTIIVGSVSDNGTKNPQTQLVSSSNSAVPSPSTSTPLGARFTEQEDHLLIHLKEVKRAGWQEISQHFPLRKTYNLQSRYSHYLNKRDKSKDPLHWNLPEWYSPQGGGQQQGQPQATELTISRPRRGRPPRTLAMSSQVAGYESLTLASSSPMQESFNDDISSANERAPRQPKGRPRGRPRRNVQQVDYTLLRRTRKSHVEEDSVELTSASEDEYYQRSDAPSEAPSVGPENVIPVDTPSKVSFEREDATIALQATTPGQHLPYLSASERSLVQRGCADGEWDQLSGRIWQGAVLHVDFNDVEMSFVEKAIERMFKPLPQSAKRQKHLHRLLRDQPEHRLVRLSSEIRRLLPGRTRESIDAFLRDIRMGNLHSHPLIERIGAVRPNRKFSSKAKESIPSQIRQRELGLRSRRGWKSTTNAISYQMKNAIADSLGPAFSYTGASSDVHTVAWHPSGQMFAAGSVCVTDPDSMQYNRPNNLLYGDLYRGQLHEIAEHREPRLRTDTGPNSTHAMHVSQDPYLYTTVSMVAFSPNGRYMFSAGYDRYADIWRIPESPSDVSQPELVKRLRHKAEVDILTVSCEGKVATAAKKTKSNAVKLITVDDSENVEKHSFTSRKASERPDMNILPTSLQFEPNAGRLLLAGFGANKRQDGLDVNGDICLWNVETLQELQVYGSTRNVFDVAFNPCQRTQPLFAVGCVGSTNVNRGIHSVVRFYDTRDFVKYTSWIELECPALDMNEVIYCPYDENLVAAGCTSGSTYVWDVRNPDTWLYRLSHGRSLMPLYEHLNREVTDTGVRFLSWGENATRLYTGSSDGLVKVWDVVRSAEEVFVKDLITVDSGIMSGSFSPDFSKLVLGEVDGSINVLETGRDDCTVKDMEKLKYVPYVEEHYDEQEGEEGTDSTSTPSLPESGRAIASQLLANGEIQYAPFGGLPIRQALQGPNYAGPFDSSVHAPFLREQALEFQFNLAKPQGLQCSIPACKDSITTTTVEEIGDSGRSIDRIPDELRKQWKLAGNDLTVIPGKSQCSQCGRPARPLDSSAAIDQPVLCERCLFTCFRCGAPNKIRPETELLACHRCKNVWGIGALGYNCVRDSGKIVNTNSVPRLKRFDEELYLARANGEDDATYGDDMNALTDYYHSLAIDRPPSPPL